jgi:hypothetical protein
LAAQGLDLVAAHGLHLLAAHFAAQGLAAHFALHLAAHFAAHGLLFLAAQGLAPHNAFFAAHLAAHFAAHGFHAFFAAQGLAIARLTSAPPVIEVPATPNVSITAIGITVDDNILPLNSIDFS